MCYTSIMNTEKRPKQSPGRFLCKQVVMLNDKNLVPFSNRSESEARENGRKGGRKSGETRRRKKGAEIPDERPALKAES